MEQDVPRTILNQLGGECRLQAMIGARYFASSSDSGRSVSFNFRGSKTFTHVKITLEPDDTYKVEFMKFRGVQFTAGRDFTSIYAGQLKSLIENQTGLVLSL